jgi:hypothetical protein
MQNEYSTINSPAERYGNLERGLQHAQALINAFTAMAAYDEWGEGELIDTAKALHDLSLGVFTKLEGCAVDFLQASGLLNRITDIIIKSSATGTPNLLRDDEALMRIRDLLSEASKEGAGDE